MITPSELKLFVSEFIDKIDWTTRPDPMSLLRAWRNVSTDRVFSVTQFATFANVTLHIGSQCDVFIGDDVAEATEKSLASEMGQQVPAEVTP